MFGRRPDGKQLKKVPMVFKLIPSVMKERNDSQVLFKEDIPIKKIEEYIAEKAKEGIKLSLMDVVIAGIIRILSERPQLNRFCINGRVYTRKSLSLSLVIKKSLDDDSDETPLKFMFKGGENIFEVKEITEKLIKENKEVTAKSSIDKFVEKLSSIPYGLVIPVVTFLKWLDKHGLLPKKIIDMLPFHTTAFLTNVGSLGIDAIYHHLYNFGTTSMFFAMGRKKKSYIYEDDEIKQEKCITFAFVGDERICDGYYYASSFRSLIKVLKNPKVLEEKVEVKSEYTDLTGKPYEV